MIRLAPRPLLFLTASAWSIVGLCGHAAGQTTAEASQPTAVDLQRQIELLQSQVQALEAKQQAASPATTVDEAREHDETVDRVLADAQQRSETLNGMTAGWDKGRFFVASADRNFVLKPWMQFQFRYGTAYRDAEKPSGADDVQSGFEVRRVRFGIDGNLFTPRLTYLFNFGTYRANTTGNLPGGGSIGLGNAGTPELEEAWLKYEFADTPWAIRAGQFHDPLDHEAIISSKYRGAEAALSTDIFANEETYVKGVTAIYDPKSNYRFEGGFTDGIRSTDTNFEDYPNGGNGFDFGLAGRVEYKVMGIWADYGQLTAYGDTKELLVLGAAFDESQGGNSDTFSHTIDVQYANPQGLLLYRFLFRPVHERQPRNSTGYLHRRPNLARRHTGSGHLRVRPARTGCVSNPREI